MLKQKEYNSNNTAEHQQIELVKEGVENIKANRDFFNLPLKTMELMKRFNFLYWEVYKNHDRSDSTYNQLLTTAGLLEKDLVRVL